MSCIRQVQVVAMMLWLSLAAPCFAQSSDITLVAGDWPGLTQPDGNGIYFQLLKEIFEQAGYRVRTQTSNWKRARYAFFAARADVLVCDYAMAQRGYYFPKQLLDVDPPVYLFTVKPLRHLSQIKGLAVGWVLGYEFGRLLPVPVEPVEMDSHADGFRMLNANRIDGFISYQQYAHAEQARLSAWELQPARALYPVFHDSAEGKRLAQIYDEAMAKMRLSGRIKSIYGEEAYTRFQLKTLH